MKKFLLSYTLVHGEYEFAQQTVIHARTQQSAERKAASLSKQRGELLHDPLVQAIKNLDCVQLTEEQYQVLNQLGIG